MRPFVTPSPISQPQHLAMREPSTELVGHYKRVTGFRILTAICNYTQTTSKVHTKTILTYDSTSGIQHGTPKRSLNFRTARYHI